MEIKVNDWLQAADHEVEMRRWREQSGGRTRQFINVHELKGVSPEMLAWYILNRDNESYLMWHPSHFALQWEKKIVGLGAIHVAWEKINGKMAAYRIRRDSAEKSPIPPKNPVGSRLSSIIDTEGVPLFSILTESVSVGDGLKVSSMFIFPEATPDEFVEAHRQHSIEEYPGMAYKAVPFLIKRTFGYMPDIETLKKSGLIVPPEVE